jgi:predicted transglutaminase-like cysteine proteinase
MIAAVTFEVLSLKLRKAFNAVLTAITINALSIPAECDQLAHMPVSGLTRQPLGWTEFCVRQPGECVGNTTAPRDVSLSRKTWSDLVRVNRRVNVAVKPLSDLEHWGVAERWSYPDDGYGDCEDYVLLKRRMLIQAGWPREALLVTVVHDKNDQGHAVLTVTTDQGDYVLDNLNDEIRLWSETGYRFFKRQSQSHPNVWVSLGDPKSTTATATSP